MNDNETNWKEKFMQLDRNFSERTEELIRANSVNLDLFTQLSEKKEELRAAREISAMRADHAQQLEEELKEIESQHPRAMKLMKKGTPFIVIKTSEPYAKDVMWMIKNAEIKKGSWTEQCEDWAIEQFGDSWYTREENMEGEE